MGNSPPKRAAAVRDLERFTNPTGLYPTCPWDVRLVRRLIMEKRLAPRIPGRECCESVYTQECPICFMFYPGHLNMSTCCKKLICSECYLQLKPPKKIVSCPYCNRESFSITYVAPSPSAFSLSSLQGDPTPMRTPTPPIPVHANSNARSRANTANSVASHTSHTSSPQPDPSHFASVEDRERIRDDLRSQLQLTDQPIMTPPTRPSLLQSRRSSSGSNFIIASPQDAAMLAQPRYIIASANDAARLEEMMLMEAIRRSMRDLLPKEEEDEEGEDEEYQYSSSSSSSSGNDGSMDLIAGLEGRAGSDYDLLRPYQATAGSNRP